MLTWEGPGAGLQFDIRGHRFGSAGSPVGSEFLVNTATAPSQINPAVAADRSGRFVAVWQSGSDQDGSSVGIFGQRFDAAGNRSRENSPSTRITTEHPVPPGDRLWTPPATSSWCGRARTRTDRSTASSASASTRPARRSARSSPSTRTQPGGRRRLRSKSATAETSSSSGRARQFGTRIPGVFGQRFNGSAEKVGDGVRGQHGLLRRADQRPFGGAGSRRRLRRRLAEPRAGRFRIRASSAQRFDRLGLHGSAEFRSTCLHDRRRRTAPHVVDDGQRLRRRLGERRAGRVRQRRLRAAAEAPTRRQIVVDAHGIGTSDLNGVLEPLEAVGGRAAVVQRRTSFFDRLGRQRLEPRRAFRARTTRCSTPPRATASSGRTRSRAAATAARTPATRSSSARPAPARRTGTRSSGGPVRGRLAGLDAPRRRQLLGRAALAAVLQEDRDAAPPRHHDRLRRHAVLPGRPGRRATRWRSSSRRRIAGSGAARPGAGTRRRQRLQLHRGTTSRSPTSPRRTPPASTSTTSRRGT